MASQRVAVVHPSPTDAGAALLASHANSQLCCLSCSYSDPKMWVAFLGTPFLNGNDGKMEKIFRIYKHPFYNVYSLDYDVALLELSAPVRFSSTIKPICLPDNSHIFQEGARCFITGWGSTKEGGTAWRGSVTLTMATLRATHPAGPTTLPIPLPQIFHIAVGDTSAPHRLYPSIWLHLPSFLTPAMALPIPPAAPAMLLQSHFYLVGCTA